MKRFQSAVSNEVKSLENVKDLENVKKRNKFKLQSVFFPVLKRSQDFFTSQRGELPLDFKYCLN